MSGAEHKITEDDPIITAYALGELEGEELALVEDALARDPALRVSVDRIRVTCGAISEALAGEPAARKSLGRKAASAGKPKTAAVDTRRQRAGKLLEYPGLYFVVGGLSAACFAILALVQTPVNVGPGLAASVQGTRTIVPLPPLGEEPAELAGKSLVEELTEVPVLAEVAKPLLTAPVPEMQVPDPKPGHVTSEVASQQQGGQPSALAGGTMAPNVQLPFALHTIQGAPKAPLFEGYGAGTSLRPFEGASLGEDRAFVLAAAKPVSELGVRVESASYAQVRRALLEGRRPDKSSVQIEQLVNHFTFTANQAAATEVRVGKSRVHDFKAGRMDDSSDPLISTQIEYAPAPWNPSHLLVRVALQARPQPVAARPAERLLVLVEDDLSSDVRRLLAEALRGMVGRLRSNDRVILGRFGAGVERVCAAEAGVGRWDLQAGIELLCKGDRSGAGFISQELLQEVGEATRIIVCTAGQPRLPEAVSRSMAPLAVLSLGEGSLPMPTLAELSKRGSFRSDRAQTVARARELLMEEAGNPDPVVARRTLLKTSFNPKLVAEYRIIGYEGSPQAYEQPEASDLLAGQSFTALYEVIPTAEAKAQPGKEGAARLLEVGLSYEDTQRRLLRRQHFVVLNGTPAWEQASDDFRFAAAVAAMGMIMRDSPHRGTASLEQVARWASGRGVTVSAAEREEFSLLLSSARKVF